MKLHAYKKEFTYSYTFGAFPTIELLQTQPHLVQHVLIADSYKKIESLIEILVSNDIPYTINTKIIQRFTKNSKHQVIGIFDKDTDQVLNLDENHLILDHISDMGNLGTIIRTALGLGISNIALIGNTCDAWHPKSIRASMGAIFKVNLVFYNSLNDYLDDHKTQNLYAFILDKDATALKNTSFPLPFSLIFGNESAGLGVDYIENPLVKHVFIEQTDAVDSLNLPNAVSIGLYKALID